VQGAVPATPPASDRRTNRDPAAMRSTSAIGPHASSASRGRVPLDIQAEPEEMKVLLDWHPPEAALVDGAATAGRRCPAPSLRVCCRQPLHVLRQDAINGRLHDEMPMVRHDTVRQQPCLVSSSGLCQHACESVVRRGLLEQRDAVRRTVHDVEHEPVETWQMTSRHRCQRTLTRSAPYPDAS
jgi:hypothetical protein